MGYRTKFDSTENSVHTFYFPKCFLIKNSKFYIYRYLNATTRFDYEDKQYVIPYNISDTMFQVISQLIKYTVTTQIKIVTDTVDLCSIRESVRQMVKRHIVPETKPFTPPVVN